MDSVEGCLLVDLPVERISVTGKLWKGHDKLGGNRNVVRQEDSSEEDAVRQTSQQLGQEARKRQAAVEGIQCEKL